MTDFLKKYTSVKSIEQTISKETMAPITNIKFKNNDVISFTLNRIDIMDNQGLLDERIENEILKHRIFQREKKLKRILDESN